MGSPIPGPGVTVVVQRPQVTPQPRADVARLSRTCKALVDEVAKVIVGKREVLDLVTVNLLAGGNILFEDFPGMAKTLMSNTFARAAGCGFGRVQFTPDVLPGDITGASIYNQKTGEFSFRPGPVFTNVLLADEINRAPPKTQAALLEAMQERQVTLEGVTHRLPKPYIVMATQNPAEQEGCYPLPEAQMDRFLMKLSVGYPTREGEAEILRRRMARGKDEADVQPVASAEHIVAMQQTIETIHVDDSLLGYVADVVCRTREHPNVYVGASPRGSQAIFKASRALAAMRGRPFVTPDDIKSIAPHVLSHRLILKPEARIRGAKAEGVVKDVLAQAPVPTLRA